MRNELFRVLSFASGLLLACGGKSAFDDSQSPSGGAMPTGGTRSDGGSVASAGGDFTGGTSASPTGGTPATGGSRPSSVLSSVDLPDPFSPRMAERLSRAIDSEIPDSTGWPL